MTSPYQNTRKTTEESKLDIENLLHKYGASNTHWVEESKRLALLFTLQAQGKIRVVRVMPRLYSNQGFVNWKQTYRLLYWSLKPRLEAIFMGSSVDHEFMPDIVISVNGQNTTVEAQFSIDQAMGRVSTVKENPKFPALPLNAIVEVDKNGRVIPG